MPDPATLERLKTSVLSAVALKDLQPDWSDAIIDEWLNFLDALVLIAELLDIEIDQEIEAVPTSLADGELIAPSGGFLASTGQTVTGIESTAFFFARIY